MNDQSTEIRVVSHRSESKQRGRKNATHHAQRASFQTFAARGRSPARPSDRSRETPSRSSLRQGRVQRGASGVSLRDQKMLPCVSNEIGLDVRMQ
jgi:hypothetical protein